MIEPIPGGGGRASRASRARPDLLRGDGGGVNGSKAWVALGLGLGSLVLLETSCGLYGVTSGSALEADFSVRGSAGDVPLVVQFTDLSRGGATSWSWDFGDGAGSTEQNPAHTYELPAVYTVTLEVGGAGGSDVLVRDRLVRAFDGDLKGIWASPRELVGLPESGAA